MHRFTSALPKGRARVFDEKCQTKYNRNMPKYPNVTLKLILRSGNKILLLKRGGTYEFPGGRMRFLESIEEALAREFREELGAPLPGKPRLFHVWNYVSKNRRRHSVMLYFVCSLPKTRRFVSPEKLEAVWVRKDVMKKIVSNQTFVERMY